MVNPVIEELPILIAGIVNEEAIVPKVTRGCIKTPYNFSADSLIHKTQKVMPGPIDDVMSGKVILLGISGCPSAADMLRNKQKTTRNVEYDWNVFANSLAL